MAAATGASAARAELARLEAEGKVDEGMRCEILHGELIIRSRGVGHAHLRRLERQDKIDAALRYEILAGELLIRGLFSAQHDRAVEALRSRLDEWAGQHGGAVVTARGIETAHHLLVPDVWLLTPDRAHELTARRYHVVPDLVVEVTSPGSRALDLIDKREIYRGLRVPECWIVDTVDNRVLVDRRDAALSQPAERTEGTLTTEQAPGLEIPIGELLDAP